eukprot:scaffold24528_cov120-Isochrysis_galbana.AAC.5
MTSAKGHHGATGKTLGGGKMRNQTSSLPMRARMAASSRPTQTAGAGAVAGGGGAATIAQEALNLRQVNFWAGAHPRSNPCLDVAAPTTDPGTSSA